MLNSDEEQSSAAPNEPLSRNARVPDKSMPREVGDCVLTTVAEVGYRFEGEPSSGSVISYSNGGVQVAYTAIPGVERSQPGDPIRLCLISAPEDCPPGDDRGPVYRGANLRTGESWEAGDSFHYCGGA